MQLIIAEKPSAADKIAHALGPVKKKVSNGVYYYEIPKRKVIVASAVGHLFELAHKPHIKEHPIFTVEWQPTYKVSKSAEFSKKYYDVLTISKNELTIRATGVKPLRTRHNESVLEIVSEKNLRKTFDLVDADLLTIELQKPLINKKV